MLLTKSLLKHLHCSTVQLCIVELFNASLFSFNKHFAPFLSGLNATWTPCSDESCNYGSWEGHSLCSFEEFLILCSLILQNTLNVTVSALAIQNKREHPNRVTGLWKLWFLIIVIQLWPRISWWKDKYFRWRIIHFLPPRLCYDLYDLIIFIVSIRLIIIADHCCCAMVM